MELYWTQVAVPAFATFFVIIDPIGLIPMFLAMTDGMSGKARRRNALYATLFAAGILMVFAFAGQSVLDFLGISLPAFRIAGGILLFLTALEMLFEKRTERREKQVRDASAETPPTSSHHDDIWVFPLGLPLIAGPGAIASVILLMGAQAGDPVGQFVVAGVLVGVLIVMLVMFFLADRIKRYMSPTIIRAMTRLLGMILAALAVQFVITGIKGTGLV